MSPPLACEEQHLRDAWTEAESHEDSTVEHDWRPPASQPGLLQGLNAQQADVPTLSIDTSWVQETH